MTEFTASDIPPGASDDIPSPDLTCETCGKALTYSGRGRKPRFCDEHKTKSSGSGTRSTVSDRELNSACENLNATYNALLMPMMLVSPQAAQVWESQIDGLNARNRVILANNRNLVKRINAAGEKGGNIAFILSHGIALAPVVIAFRLDMAARRAERAAQEDYVTAEQGPVWSDTGAPTDPDMAFTG